MEGLFSKPNQITYIRILLIPVFVMFLLMDIPYRKYIAAFIFITLSLSDAFDGYIARKKNQITGIGKILDPIADKLLISTALVFLVDNGVPLWIAVVILAREWIITILRLSVLHKEVIAAAMLGKIKTATQTIAIIAVIMEFPFSGYLLILAVIFTIISGIEYLIKIIRISDKRILNVPNIITFMRFSLIPLFAYTLLKSKLKYALIIFGIIAISDKFDGISAKIMNQVTEFGRIFDSLTDGLLILTSFILFYVGGYIEAKWILLLILPAIIIPMLKVIFLKKEKKTPVTPIAKISVGMTYVAIVSILIDFAYKEEILIITFILVYLSMSRYLILTRRLFKHWTRFF